MAMNVTNSRVEQVVISKGTGKYFGWFTEHCTATSESIGESRESEVQTRLLVDRIQTRKSELAVSSGRGLGCRYLVSRRHASRAINTRCFD